MQEISVDFEKDFSSEFYEEASTTRTLKNIKKSLIYSLKKKYNISDKDVIDTILKMHGLHVDNFDFVKNIEKIINEKLNDVSIDDNSNKNEKAIPSIMQEIKIAIDKAVGYDYLYRMCKELYGKSEAKRLMGSLYDFSLGINDSSKLMLPYCFAIDASKLVLEGRNFGVLPSAPAKRISSYISALCETTHQLTNFIAGAIAISTLFLDVAHLSLYKEENNFEDIKGNKKLRKAIENEFQQLVHSLNHLSRNASESPFTNVSIFDRPKLRAMLSKENMGWYFTYNKELFTKMFGEECNSDNYIDFVIEYIMEIQFIFLDFYDKGDALNDGRQFRFPVNTLNVSKEYDEQKKEWIVSDKKFLKDICKYEIYKYNIYSSLGMKVASCCFKRDTTFISYDAGLYKISSFNDFNHGDNIEVLTHTGDIKKAKVYNYGKQPLQKVTLINSSNGLKKDVYCTSNHSWFLINNTRTNSLKEGDVLLPYVHSDIWSVKSIEELNIEEEVWCLEVEDNHSFVLEDSIVTGNCRLINDTEMMNLGSQVNSFGGSAISLGSHRVVTINFNRIALQSDTEEKFYELLNSKIEETAKVLKAHKELIKHLEQKGLQPFITNNWLVMNKMFSTFGVMGIYEAVENMMKITNKDFDTLMEEILVYLNTKVKEYSKEYGLFGNIEAIPGESFAVRLAKADKLIFGDVKVATPLYSNQFIPLWENASIYERMEKDGKFQGKMTGGSICHFTLGEKITGLQSEKLIKYAIGVGNEHFALNAIYSECKNHHNSFGKHEVCPVCGEPIIEYYTRVIGYFSPVSSWNQIRREWEFPKRVVGTIDN